MTSSPPDTGFFARLAPRGSSPPPGGTVAPPGAPVCLTTPSLQLDVSLLGDAETFEDARRGLGLVLHGRLWPAMPLRRLADLYEQRGPGFVRGLNGSFALLLADARRDTVLAATDRLGSRAVFRTRSGPVTLLSSKLKHLVSPHARLDPTGVAWYLSNGVVCTHRTLLDGVARLPRATLFAYAGHAPPTSERYWAYDFDHAFEERPPEQLKAELSSLLVQAVSRCLEGSTRTLVSLSAGWDSAGVLGVAHEQLGAQGLETFSYGLREDDAASDAAVSARMAALCGLPHTFLRSYDGDLWAAIERNARWGDGVTHFCDEALAWETLSERHGGERLPVLFGDAAFGVTKAPLGDIADVLQSRGVRGFDALQWLEPLLPSGSYRELHEGQAADIAELARAAPSTCHTADLNDYWQVEVRGRTTLHPWRENFAGRGFDVLNPWLDNDVVDYVRHVAVAQRWRKALYKECVAALAPRVFGVERAGASGYVPDWPAEGRREAPSLAAMCVRIAAESRSPLDDLVDPGVAEAVCRLESFTAAAEPAPARDGKAQATLKKNLRRVRRKFLGKRSVRQVTPADFLLRYLVLRRFLEIAGAESISGGRLGASRSGPGVPPGPHGSPE